MLVKKISDDYIYLNWFLKIGAIVLLMLIMNAPIK